MNEIPANWERCAREAKMAPEMLGECLVSDTGRELLRRSLARAEVARAQGSPTLIVAGARHEGGRGKLDLMRAVCGAASGAPSAACAKLPAPVKIELVVLSDERCRDEACQIEPLVENLRLRFFPGLQVRTVDYASAAGKRLFSELKIDRLPALLFGESVKQSPRYPSVARWLDRAGEYQRLRVPATFDPTAEICDNGTDDTGNGKIDCADATCTETLRCRPDRPRQLDVFVMSQCPYGARALLAMQEVLSNFKGQVTFNVHYIADAAKDGTFQSLHGQPEVEENIRQLCAAKHYGAGDRYLDYVWCRSRDYRSSAWRRCAGGGISETVIESCATGPAGQKLLSESISIGEALAITGSPTWLANNRHQFHAITAEQIKANLCQHNDGLQGCDETLSDDSTNQGSCGQ